jgi:hypothetical protein
MWTELPVRRQLLPLRQQVRLREIASSAAVWPCPFGHGRAACETMIGVRLITVLLAVTLTGPSVGSLVCDWACAAKHQRTEANGSCHQHSMPGTTPTVAAGHSCHTLTSAPASILTDARQAGFSAPAIVEVPLTVSIQSAGDAPHRTRDVAHAPPPPLMTSLRI